MGHLLIPALKIRASTVAILVAGLALAGCSTAGGTAGGFPGLAFGALPGSGERIEGSDLINALNGGIIDPALQADLDASTRKRALEAEYKALEHTPAGQAVSWKNQGRGLRGEVVASQPYRVGSQDCRQYTHTVYASGAPVAGRGTACRNIDGSWTPLT
jgi:surface antigen